MIAFARTPADISAEFSADTETNGNVTANENANSIANANANANVNANAKEKAKLQEESRNRRVENALFRMATGYKKKTVKPQKVKTVLYDPDTGKKTGEEESIVNAVEEEFVEPDLKSVIYWLNNRASGRWQEHPGGGTEEGGEVAVLPELPAEEQSGAGGTAG